MFDFQRGTISRILDVDMLIKRVKETGEVLHFMYLVCRCRHIPSLFPCGKLAVHRQYQSANFKNPEIEWNLGSPSHGYIRYIPYTYKFPIQKSGHLAAFSNVSHHKFQRFWIRQIFAKVLVGQAKVPRENTRFNRTFRQLHASFEKCAPPLFTTSFAHVSDIFPHHPQIFADEHWPQMFAWEPHQSLSLPTGPRLRLLEELQNSQLLQALSLRRRPKLCWWHRFLGPASYPQKFGGWFISLRVTQMGRLLQGWSHQTSSN